VCRDSFSGTALGCQIIIFLPRREKKRDAFPRFFFAIAGETVKVFKTSGILEKKNTEKLEKC